MQLGTGWYTPAGVIHAPASVVTYEPQWNSDVNTIMENVTMGEVNATNLLTDCQPAEEKGDVDALFDQIDWKRARAPTINKNTSARRSPARNTKGLSNSGSRMPTNGSRQKR